MADPRAVVPYHDPYDSGPYTEIMNLLNDSEHPRIVENNIPPLEGSLASPNPNPMFDEEIQDVDEPLMDQAMWDFIYGSDNGGEGINSQAGPSQIFTESSGTNPPRGDGNEQNHGFGNVRPLSVWPLPSDPINCTFCQVFREIVHFNSDNVMKLEIHGRLGVICHAILQSRPNANVNSSGNHQYQMLDFCKTPGEEVKQFLMQYCLERKLEGYIMQQDPLTFFYEALCVGVDWDAILNPTDDFDFPPSPPDSGTAGDMEKPAAVQPEAAEHEIETNPRISLAEQRERTANMTLDDLRDYVHLPIEKAARRLNVCPTVVKRICRRNGLRRWPSRKITSINRQISRLRPSLDSDDAETRVHAEAEISRLEREIAELVP
ncbi:unnamed protein product [Prunus brigantina]